MTEIILSLIKQLNSSVFILLGLLLLAFIAVFKVGKWSQTFEHHDQKMNKLEGLSEKVIGLTTKVDLIYQAVNPFPTVQARSPISLTPLGQEIKEKIQANVILTKYIAELVKEVDGTNPTSNAYDIQERSMKAAKEKMINLLDENELNIIKQEAYSRGTIVENIMAVFGVLLRNHILSEKGIPIASVDKNGDSEKPT